MHTLIKKLALTAGTIAMTTAASVGAHAQTVDGDIVPNSWIFVMQADVDAGAMESAVSRDIRKAKGKLKHVYKFGMKGFSAEMTAQDAKKFANEVEGVAYVVPNSYVEIMGAPAGKGKKPPTTGEQTMPWGVARVNGGSFKGNAMAWVVDTGVDSRHPDLRVHKGKSTSIIDNSRGLTDGQGHGTHVAGIIGARDNDFGVVGVAPGVTIASVKVLDDDGKGTVDNIIAGLDYAASKARSNDVINLSLGGGYSKALNDAVLRASQTATVVVAAGNYRRHAKDFSPASTAGDNVMTVSAFGEGDVFSISSNYGNPPIDCSAPGVNVLSTLPGGQYGEFTGTSMAAPHVAGMVLKGNVSVDGSVNNDPDGDPDPICVF